MADVIFPCPSCKQDIQCDDSFRGKKIQCPVCNNFIMVVLPAAEGGKRLGVATPGGDKTKPFVPMLQQTAVAHKKSSASKKYAVAGAVVLVLAALVIVAMNTGLWPRILALVGKGNPEEAAASAPAPVPAAPAEARAAKAAAAEPVIWTTNLAEAGIPRGAVSGKINETTFTVDSAKIDNGILVLRCGTNQIFDLEVGVNPVARPGESVAGKKIVVAKEIKAGIPQVWKRWKVEGKPQVSAKTYRAGYLLKLEFDAVTDDQVKGRIYLAFPDETESVVAGNFTATIGQTAVSQAAPAQAAQPAQAQMSAEMQRRYGLGPSRSGSPGAPASGSPYSQPAPARRPTR